MNANKLNISYMYIYYIYNIHTCLSLPLSATIRLILIHNVCIWIIPSNLVDSKLKNTQKIELSENLSYSRKTKKQKIRVKYKLKFLSKIKALLQLLNILYEYNILVHDYFIATTWHGESFNCIQSWKVHFGSLADFRKIV